MGWNKNLYVVILAGGSGTRFWPMSRRHHPKQLLKIAGDTTLLEQTIGRVMALVAPERILIVTNKLHADKIAQQVRPFGISARNILLEPSGKNTAPAIAWAAARILSENRSGIMAVLPSDHLILNPTAFRRYIRQAAGLAQRHYLVTLGIVPSRPETGYGYLKIKPLRLHGQKTWQVEKFTEKPSLVVAKRFVEGRRHLWNSGMFIWGCADIMAAFARHLPAVAEYFKEKISDRQMHKSWSLLPAISIDYGILEKADNVLTIPASDMGWSDLGLWASLREVMLADKNGNIVKGDVLAINCAHTLVYGQERLVAAIGLKDLIIVDTPDALLVCQQDFSGHVKDLVEILKRKKRREI